MRARAAVAIAVVSVALGAVVTVGATAAPSRYIYEMCDSVLPGGGTQGLRWAQSPGQPWSGGNSCAQPGGALSISLNGSSGGGSAEWGLPIEAPAGTQLESVSVLAAACGSASGLWASVLNLTDWPTQNCVAEDRTFTLSPETKGYIVELACSGVYGSCGAGPWVSARAFATTLLDTQPPSISPPQGSLLQGGVLRGRQSLTARASDSGGGLQSISVLVNGLPASQTRSLSCNIAEAKNPSVVGTVAAQPSPCPPEASASWSLETSGFPFHDGLNGVVVCVSDFSTLGDPNTSCTTPEQVLVDNSCAESEVGGGQVLSADFARSHDDTVTVGFGREATISGRLSDEAGDPIRGARLCVKMQIPGVDDRAQPVGSVLTDANGSYRYRVAPGPNREVVVGYRHDTAQVARSLRYYAHARAALHVGDAELANGERARFWGQLPGPNGAGRVVVLQASAVGSKRWITFRRATANRKAVFHASYRFRSTTRRTRYRFRAVVPRQAGYPWVEGHSKPVEVLVRPAG